MSVETIEKPGNSWIFNEALAESLCDKLALGQSLKEICEAPDMPDRGTVMRWMEKSEKFATRIAHARDLQADYMDDKILDVAVMAENGKIDPNAARVAIAAYQWRASKLKPKKYGDSTTIKGDKENPLDIGLAALLDVAAVRRTAIAQAPESVPIEGEYKKIPNFI